MATFAQRLRALRTERDLTLTYIAKHVHRAVSAVSQWEDDKHVPDHDVLVALADLFNVSVDYLLGRTDDPTPPGRKPAVDGDHAPSGRDFSPPDARFARAIARARDLPKKDAEELAEVLEFLIAQREKGTGEDRS